MLLAVDIGNTNTVFGIFEDQILVDSWRVSTSVARTADENAALLCQLFSLGRLHRRRLSPERPVGSQSPAGPSESRTGAIELTSAIVASVVPGAVPPLLHALEQRFSVRAMVVGPGLKSGMPILYENPKEVGADRIVNAVAAYDRYPQGLIIVDFGTATTFDCVTPKGEYLGGVIAPGLTISADALYRHAAKLPRVEIKRPKVVVGRNTVNSMQSGLFYGYAGLVDGIVAEMANEVGFEVRTLATGGLAPLITEASKRIDEADEMLTLRGLQILYSRNV
jgi:type III pantothenate kinase